MSNISIVKEFLNTLSVEGNTYQKYYNYLAKFVEFIEKSFTKDIKTIQKNMVIEYFNHQVMSSGDIHDNTMLITGLLRYVDVDIGVTWKKEIKPKTIRYIYSIEELLDTVTIGIRDYKDNHKYSIEYWLVDKIVAVLLWYGIDEQDLPLLMDRDVTNKIFFKEQDILIDDIVLKLIEQYRENDGYKSYIIYTKGKKVGSKEPRDYKFCKTEYFLKNSTTKPSLDFVKEITKRLKSYGAKPTYIKKSGLLYRYYQAERQGQKITFKSKVDREDYIRYKTERNNSNIGTE